jgi:hypothetical protein
VTTFVTRQGGKEQERTGKNRTNRTTQILDIAINCGETVAIASLFKNGLILPLNQRAVGSTPTRPTTFQSLT